MHGRPEGPVPSRRGTSGSNQLSSSGELYKLDRRSRYRLLIEVVVCTAFAVIGACPGRLTSVRPAALSPL
jgi:hypothetical protein